MLQAQHPTENDPMQFARAIIASYEKKLREQTPVAWRSWYEPANNWTIWQQTPSISSPLQPLFTHPVPVAEGYALVPIEPTEAMLIQITPVSAELSEWRVNYKAMLAAARSE
jgi:hypothetical protein